MILQHLEQKEIQLAAVEAQGRKHTRSFHERNVSWRQFGQGEPLILLHGGHGSWLHWLRNIEELAHAYEVWVPDLPGFNDSELCAQEAAPGDPLGPLVEAVKATMDENVGAGRPICMAGFSFGGLIAARIAAERGSVRKLALIGPGGHGSMRRIGMNLIDWKKAATPAERREAFRHNLLAQMIHDESAIDEQAIEIHDFSCTRTRFKSKAIAGATDILSYLDAYTGPTLLLLGEHDATCSPDEVASRLSAPSRRRTVEILPDAGHWLPYEQAEAVNARLAAWFGSA